MDKFVIEWHNLRLFLFSFIHSFIHKSHALSSFYFYLNAYFFLCYSTHALKFSFPLLPVLLMSTTVLYLGYPHLCFGWIICFVFYIFLSFFVWLFLYVLRSFTHFLIILSAFFALLYIYYRNWWILVFYVFYKND